MVRSRNNGFDDFNVTWAELCASITEQQVLAHRLHAELMSLREEIAVARLTLRRGQWLVNSAAKALQKYRPEVAIGRAARVQ